MAFSDDQRTLLSGARRAILATITADGRPRLVPCVFAVQETAGEIVVYSPLDDKPKSVADPHRLARVRDIVERPQVSLLVDRWSEEWSELEWLRLEGRALLLEPDPDPAEHGTAISLLRAKYGQYADRPIERWPLLRIEVDRVVGWRARP